MNRLRRYAIVLVTNLIVIFVVRQTSVSCRKQDQEDPVVCPPIRFQSEESTRSNTSSPEENLIQHHTHMTASQQEPVIYLITATYQRQSQKADLVSLCHTLKHVPSLVWIVVENSASQSPVIRAVLGRCNISAVHLTVQTPERIQAKKKYSPKVTGVVHRNTGLGWVREHCSRQDCGGVVLFGDDDDRYDLRLFDEIRKTERVSVFMVGLTGGLLMEGPYCKNGSVAQWHRVWTPERPVPVDMQGFAINVRLLLKRSDVWIEGGGAYTDMGYVEASRFIFQFVSNTSMLECRTQMNEVLVWRTRTVQSPLWNEKYEKSDTSIEL
ncbi:hypothetical protein EMCRGX_G015107 [Ephydatia muelleri]|eukprot:Em0005g945a